MLAEKYVDELTKLYQEKKDSLDGLRSQAWQRLLELGVPRESHESYRKVSLKPLYEEKEERRQTQEKAVFSDLSGFEKLSFVNGQIESYPRGNGFTVSSFEEAMQTYGFFLQKRLKERFANEDDFFSLATDALHEKSGFIYLPPHQGKTLFLHITHDFLQEAPFFPRLQIVVGQGSSLVIFAETANLDLKGLQIHELVDISLERGAICKYIDLTAKPSQGVVVKNVRVSLKRESQMQFFSATAGGELFRQNIQCSLLEEGASAFAKGILRPRGKDQVSTHVEMRHLAPHTTSRQHFKGVLLEEGTSVFTGKIYVKDVAQKTESYQLSNHLILGTKARAHVKPCLEIFADDVKASHGATVADMSEEEIFYMQTRGLKKESIATYLAYGFLDALAKEETEEAILEKVRKLYVL